jgi:gamma-glutamyltranspeptidase
VRFSDAVFEELRRLGHDIERLNPYDDTVGHAGAIVLQRNGLMEAGSDVRSDGAAAGW